MLGLLLGVSLSVAQPFSPPLAGQGVPVPWIDSLFAPKLTGANEGVLAILGFPDGRVVVGGDFTGVGGPMDEL